MRSAAQHALPMLPAHCQGERAAPEPPFHPPSPLPRPQPRATTHKPPCLPPCPGVALVAHQIRRAITLDRATKLPRLEDSDEPFEFFLASCAAAGLATRVVSTRQTCSNVDSDPMVLVGVGRSEGALRALPAWEHGGGGDGAAAGQAS